MTDLWLAVDGGNTKTDAIVLDACGEVVGRGRAGNVDLSGVVSEQAAATQLVMAVTDALAEAQVDAAQLRHAAFRLAGIDWPEDVLVWRDVLTRSFPALGSYSVDNDAFGPLRLVAPDGVGISVVLGTGPAVAARNTDGHACSLGWWLREPLGAVGLGEAALARVYRARLGMAPPTAMTAAVLEHFGDPDPEALLHAFTHRGHTRGWPEVASLAPLVCALAVAGDSDADAIVLDQAHLVARYVVAVAVEADLLNSEVPIAFAGSVLAAPESPVAAALREELSRVLPRSTAVVAVGPPVNGVALEALAETGQPYGSAVVDRLISRGRVDSRRRSLGDR